MGVPTVADYVAMCNGRLLVAPRNLASIVVLNLYSTTTESTWPLQAPPGSVALDPLRGFLFAAEPSMPQLERIEIANGTTVLIPLPAPAIGLTLGKDGRLFAALDDATSGPNRSLAVIDGEAAVVDAVPIDKFGVFLVYDRSQDQLITGDLDGALRRFAFDPVAKTLKFMQERADAGHDCRDLAISPDGKHLAYLCAGGATSVGGLVDISSANLSDVQGTWQAPAFPALQADPRGATFSPDGKQLVVSTGEEYVFFDVPSHAAIIGAQIGGTCWSRKGVRMSPFGKQVYVLDDCGGFDAEHQELYSDWLMSPF